MINDNDVKVFAKEKEEMLISKLSSGREHSPSSADTRQRNEFERDYARILYSSSFRRLQGKMQLFEVDPQKFNRNRLTHSLEVAQIARSIASELELEHHVVAELAALAHDIGNPPFGHSGEKQLNKIAKDFGGYEGNAQALRILRSLEIKHPNCPGLNLTHRAILSVVKYPFKNENGNKKFLYDNDYKYFTDLVNKYELDLQPGEKTIDAQIMDLSDEIAYAAHDLEDALSRSMVSIEDIVYEFGRSDYKDSIGSLNEIIEKSKATASKAFRLNSSEEFAIIFRKELTSNIVNVLVNDITVTQGENSFRQLGFGTKENLSSGLKDIVFKVIMRKRDIKSYEHKGNMIITDLFNFYNSDNNIEFISPQLYRTLPEEKINNEINPLYQKDKERAIVDYISGMMDTFAIREWETHCRK